MSESKWITDLNIKYKSIKLTEENIEAYLDDLGFADDLLDITPKAHCTPVRNVNIRNTDTIKCWGGCRAMGSHCWWKCKNGKRQFGGFFCVMCMYVCMHIYVCTNVCIY